MAIDKKLIHFKTWNTFISNTGVNGNYTTPSTSATSSSPALYGQIKETSIVFIQDVQKIWTHGKLYDCSTPDLSAYLTAEDLATLNAFMNNSSVSKSGETLTVEINGSTQSLTNTWRSISDKTNGTSSTISASEKAVKDAYDLAASKTSNTGTVTSVTPGTGLTGTSSDAAITTSGTINLKTAGTSEIGGIKVATVGTAASGANTTVNANKFAVHVDSDGLGYVAIPAYTNNSGDITGVTAGNGLTGGATSGNATLNVGAGTGITVAADSVSVNLKDATALTVDATTATTTSGRVYPVAVDKSGYLAVNVPWKNDDTKSFTITASANDDDVVVLSGTNGTNKVTYTASHAKTFGNTTAPYTAKYTSGNSTTSISGYGSSATIKIPQITVDEYGHVRAGADESVTITMPSAQTIPTLSGGASAETGKYVSGVTVSGHTVTVKKGTLPTIPTTLKNPNALTFGNKSYDGSSAQTITAADLGLDSALKFHGTSKTAITDGSETQTVTLSDDTQHTAENGCVLFYGNKEFVWNGSSWEELGNEGNYKVKQTAVSSPSASGSTTAFINTISQNTNGVITVTKKNLAAATTSVIGGLKLYNAAKTTVISPNSATTTDGRYYAVELDKDGKAFVNVPWTDTDTNTDTKNTTGTTNKASTKLFLAGATTQAANPQTYSNSNCYIGTDNCLYSNGSKVLTSYTNTTYDAGTGLSLSGTTFSHADTNTNISEDTSYGPTADVTQSAKNTATFKVPQVTLDQFGHVKSVTERTITVTDTDTNTNTHYTSKNIVGTSSTATSNGAVTGTGGVYLNHLEQSAVKSTHKIVGAGSVKVTSDSSGNITITGTDTNTDTSTTYNGHYTPTGSAQTGTASGSTLGFGGAVVTGLTYDGKGHVTGFSTSKLPSNPNTDASCTETGHYTPATESTTNKQSAGSGKYISGIKLDSKKHVVGIDTGTLPSFTESYKGTVTSITPGTGLTGTSSDTAITSSGTINLKTASSSEIGGIKIGYSESGKNYPVQLDSDYKAYVYVPWTDNNTDTKNTAGSSNKTGSKLLLVGATSTTTGTTYTNSNCYVGTDNCLYSGGTKVLTSHQDISGKAPNNHASTATTYGVATSGTSAKYGHVKLVSGNVNGQTYTDGVAAAAAHSHSNYLTSHQDISGKQDKLVSGENIKTINGQSVLGSGNITISAFADHGYTTDIIEPGLYKVIQELAIDLRSITSHPNSIYTIYIEPMSDPLEIIYPTNFKWCNGEPNFASIGDDGKVVELNILVLDDGSSSNLNTCLCTWAVFE